MSCFKLGLPSDIPWERICVTEDMMDPVVCDSNRPPKWQTSLAAFKYTPDEEYQEYPKYKITYLKITATITGYQPIDKEIQGKIDWDGVDATTEYKNEVLKELLNSYHPCNGALLQVNVGPKGQKPEMDIKDYPFFLDFEPKKRELYEMATDTGERSSRSIESLNLTKSAGATQSLEILDVDMGGGGFSASAQAKGSGGGFSYQAPNGQWGTKRMNSDQSLSTRSSDVGQEKRESYSYSTQISQMYNLLSSYHMGTNRALFFIQPRPHTLEEPSGFVRGPRAVDGIQEFFMVVAQPKEQEDFCVSLRLDTSHLTNTDIMDYERKTAQTGTALANATLPTKNDTKGRREVKWTVSYLFATDDIYYVNYTKTVVNNEVYTAPDGFIIEGYHNLVNSNVGTGASSQVTLSPDRKSLTIKATATSSIWFRDEGAGACVSNCPPETLGEKTARAERQLQVNLISEVATKVIGKNEALLITTRGLCCCTDKAKRVGLDDYVVDVKKIPDNLSVAGFLDKYKTSGLYQNTMRTMAAAAGTETPDCKDCKDNELFAFMQPEQVSRYTMRLANELSDFIKTESIKTLNESVPEPVKYYETEFFINKLQNRLVQYELFRKDLKQTIEKEVETKNAAKLEKFYGRKLKEVTRSEVLRSNISKLTRATGDKPEKICDFKLKMLGFRFRQPDQQKTTRTISKKQPPKKNK